MELKDAVGECMADIIYKRAGTWIGAVTGIQPLQTVYDGQQRKILWEYSQSRI
jgi:hypothetical protein